MIGDRNFDDLAERFQKRVYGGLKGRIRLAVLRRDLGEELGIWDASPMKILDVGAGLGQLSVELAARGHRVSINDVSARMLEKARAQAREAGVAEQISWRRCPYQQLAAESADKFDVILCHALMEWLAEPADLIPRLMPLLAAKGLLSLTFYNRHALVYRNLLRGNFRLLDSGDLSGDPGGLTPINPQLPEAVEQLLDSAGLDVIARSGIRVFNDYVQLPRGGNQNADAIVEMELRYSNRYPYLLLGRYLHFICKRR